LGHFENLAFVAGQVHYKNWNSVSLYTFVEWRVSKVYPRNCKRFDRQQRLADSIYILLGRFWNSTKQITLLDAGDSN